MMDCGESCVVIVTSNNMMIIDLPVVRAFSKSPYFTAYASCNSYERRSLHATVASWFLKNQKGPFLSFTIHSIVHPVTLKSQQRTRVHFCIVRLLALPPSSHSLCERPPVLYFSAQLAGDIGEFERTSAAVAHVHAPYHHSNRSIGKFNDSNIFSALTSFLPAT